MTDTSEHRIRALEHLEDAEIQQDRLDALRDNLDAPNRQQQIAECHQNIGYSLKLAHIEATLAVEWALNARTTAPRTEAELLEVLADEGTPPLFEVNQ